MKNLLVPFAAVALATAFAHAAPTDDFVAAAQRITAAPNYSWTRTTAIANSQFPVVPIEGRTEKGGYTVTKVSFNENTFQTVTKVIVPEDARKKLGG